MSNLDAFADKTFATFDESINGVQRAYKKARHFAEHPEGWLFLSSTGFGCGKTHLAAAIVHEVLPRNYKALFAVVPDLLDHLRSTFGPQSEVAYDQRFEMIRTIPLLVLDDLGTENATGWAREKLYQIINHRYNYRLPTVITSNRDIDKDIDKRISSRICDVGLSELIEVDAADYRKRPKERRTFQQRS